MLNFTLFRSRPKFALGSIGTESRCGQTPRIARVALAMTLSRDGWSDGGGGMEEEGNEEAR